MDEKAASAERAITHACSAPLSEVLCDWLTIERHITNRQRTHTCLDMVIIYPLCPIVCQRARVCVCARVCVVHVRVCGYTGLWSLEIDYEFSVCRALAMR